MLRQSYTPSAKVSNDSVVAFKFIVYYVCVCFMYIEEPNGTFQFLRKMEKFLLLSFFLFFFFLYSVQVNGLYKTTAEAGRVDELSRQTVLITMEKMHVFQLQKCGI